MDRNSMELKKHKRRCARGALVAISEYVAHDQALKNLQLGPIESIAQRALQLLRSSRRYRACQAIEVGFRHHVNIVEVGDAGLPHSFALSDAALLGAISVSRGVFD